MVMQTMTMTMVLLLGQRYSHPSRWQVNLVCLSTSTLQSSVYSNPPPSTAQGYPNSIEALAAHIKQPQFPELLQHFLYGQLNQGAKIQPNIPFDLCPDFKGQILVYHLAVAPFFAPSDLCGIGGMYHKRIWSNPNWGDGYI